MSEIKRYGFGAVSLRDAECSSGAFVLFTDYDRTVARADALELEVAHWQQEAAAYKPAWDAMKAGIAAAEAHVAELQAQIDALRSENQRLQWRPITPENLPKVGDEVWRDLGPEPEHGGISVEALNEEWVLWTIEDYNIEYWTHFRPINAPARAEAPQEKP